MLLSNFDEGTLGVLAILAVGSVILLHFILFREYFRKEKFTLKKLKELENQVKLEIHRSRQNDGKEDQLSGLKNETDEKLEVVKLQVEGMKAREKDGKSG
jgi:hypothetical protein